MYLPISLTIIPPRGFDVYKIWFCLAYHFDLLQIAEKQARVEVAQKRWSRQNLAYSILKATFSN